MSDEWGPWRDHDGKGYPVPKGTYVNVLLGDGSTRDVIITQNHPDHNAWSWWQPWYRFSPQLAIIRYRIRKPKGLLILESILREVERESENV